MGERMGVGSLQRAKVSKDVERFQADGILLPS